MKTLVIWSRATDWKILSVFGFLCCLLFAAAIGLVIPAPDDGKDIRILEACITTMLFVFVWATFRLFRPARLTQPRAWAIAEFIVVPVIWTCFVAALGLWFGYIYDMSHIRFEELQNVAVL